MDRLQVHVLQVQRAEFVVFELSSPNVECEALTGAERDVVKLVLAGYRNSAIAATRGTAVSTVAHQLSAVFRKLNVNSRAELATHFNTDSPCQRR